MNIIRKMLVLITNIFTKKEEVKKLEEHKNEIENNNQKEKFIESLIVSNEEPKSEKKVETLICNGDGLGIQKKLTC